MYFWNIEKLTKDLKKGLSEKEKFKYMMGLSILSAPVVLLPLNENIYDYLSGGIEIILGLLLIFLFYKVNGAKKGKDFLVRFISLSFVTCIRTLVFILLPLMVLLIIFETIYYGINIPEESGWDLLLFTTFYMIGYIYLQIKYLKKVVN